MLFFSKPLTVSLLAIVLLARPASPFHVGTGRTLPVHPSTITRQTTSLRTASLIKAKLEPETREEIFDSSETPNRVTTLVETETIRNGNLPSQPPQKQRNLRMQVFSLLNLPIVEVLAAMAVLLSSFLVAVSTLNDLPPETYTVIGEAIFLLNIIFALDFFVRWYAAGQFKLIYLTKPLVVIDIIVVLLPLALVSVMPLLEKLGVLGETQDMILYGLQDSSGLQNLLLLRVLRLQRVLTDINTFSRFRRALGLSKQNIRPYQLQLARVLLSLFTLLSVASGLIYSAEHNVNPDIPDYFTALYFGLTTLTTVGFGDVAPVTFAGRLVVCGSILAGVAIIPAQAAKLVEALLEFQEDQDGKKPAKRASGKVPKKMVESTILDGMGPSGEPIENPPNEMTAWTSGRKCSQCGALFHRTDARFCWSCGVEM